MDSRRSCASLKASLPEDRRRELCCGAFPTRLVPRLGADGALVLSCCPSCLNWTPLTGSVRTADRLTTTYNIRTPRHVAVATEAMHDTKVFAKAYRRSTPGCARCPSRPRASGCHLKMPTVPSPLRVTRPTICAALFPFKAWCLAFLSAHDELSVCRSARASTLDRSRLQSNLPIYYCMWHWLCLQHCTRGKRG